MNTTSPGIVFEQPDICAALDGLSDAELDKLAFGVIGFDAETLVRRYNAIESQMAGLAPARVLGSALFTAVAPCMNNFLVAQRFEDAVAEGAALDAMLDYVFTLRMRPSKVQLRLAASPSTAMRYVLVQRRT
jgi:photoactive yellow protein